jgi:hypothetical protein
MISDAVQNKRLAQQGTNDIGINAGRRSNGTQRASAERDGNASNQAIFAEMDDVEQMVILLNRVLERQLEVGRHKCC